MRACRWIRSACSAAPPVDGLVLAAKHGLVANGRAKHAPKGGLDPEALAAAGFGRGGAIRAIAAELRSARTTVRHWIARYELPRRSRYAVRTCRPRGNGAHRLSAYVQDVTARPSSCSRTPDAIALPTLPHGGCCRMATAGQGTARRGSRRVIAAHLRLRSQSRARFSSITSTAGEGIRDCRLRGLTRSIARAPRGGREVRTAVRELPRGGGGRRRVACRQ